MMNITQFRLSILNEERGIKIKDWNCIITPVWQKRIKEFWIGENVLNRYGEFVAKETQILNG
jgi:hypothetical protein